MLKVVFFFYEEFCLEGMVVEVNEGDNLLEVVYNVGVEIYYVCDGFCVCMICYVVICEGFDFLNESLD